MTNYFDGRLRGFVYTQMGQLKVMIAKKRFHDLRQSAATILLVAGVHPKVVQERLEHSTIAMTMDIYSPVLPSMQQEMRKD